MGFQVALQWRRLRAFLNDSGGIWVCELASAAWLWPDRSSVGCSRCSPVFEVEPRPQTCLWLRFHDGLEDSVDLSSELWGPMVEPLRNPELFDQVMVDPELETVVWPNGADLAPECLSQAAQRASLPVP